MIARYAIGIVALIASAPALAEPLDAAAAQRFVLGKLFAFTCSWFARWPRSQTATARSWARSSCAARV